MSRPAVSARPPYDRTAVRPGWDELPQVVRAEVVRRCGAEVVGATSAGGGFTRGFAGVVTLADGSEVFVKAAHDTTGPHAAPSYRQEARVLNALPAAVPAPRLRWSAEVDGWVVLGIDAVHGRMPGLPWTPTDVAAAVRACEQAATALADPAVLASRELGQLGRLADDLAGDATTVGWFGAVRSGAARSTLVSPWARANLAQLQQLVEHGLVAVDGTTACHGDLRPDNVVLDAAGTAWVCDWNWLALAAPWTDLVGLLLTVHADGLDADVVLAGSWLTADVPPDDVDGWLALIAAFMLAQAEGVDDPDDDQASRWLSAHRAYFGTAALAWLQARRER